MIIQHQRLVLELAVYSRTWGENVGRVLGFALKGWGWDGKGGEGAWFVLGGGQEKKICLNQAAEKEGRV